MYNPPTTKDTAYNCTSVDVENVSVLNVPPTTFLVGSNSMKRSYSGLPNHYQKRVRYLQLRIDDWQNDTLALFLNDLLILN